MEAAILDFTHYAIRRLLLSFPRSTLVKFWTINFFGDKKRNKKLLMSLIINQPTKDIEHIKSTFSWPDWYLKGHFRHFYMKKIPWKLLLQKSYYTNFQSPPYCYQFAAIILCPSSWYQDQDWLMDYIRAESRNDKRFLQYKFSNSTLLQTKQITFI